MPVMPEYANEFDACGVPYFEYALCAHLEWLYIELVIELVVELAI